MKVARLASILVLLLATGCGGSSTTSPAATTTTAAIPAGFELFTGTLAVQGSSFFPFTISIAGTVNVTLVSVTTGTTTPAPSTILGLGLGLPTTDGTSCTVSASTMAAPGLTTQLTIQG